MEYNETNIYWFAGQKRIWNLLFSSTEGRKMNTDIGLHNNHQTFRALPDGLGS